MPNEKKDIKQDKNIKFLKLIVIILLSLFIVVDIGIYRQGIILFHYGVLLIIFFTIGTIWIQIGPDGIKFGGYNSKQQEQSNTTIKEYNDYRKIYYPVDSTYDINNDLFNKNNN